ncbi:hypothetical protein M0804_008510 [Polistes exclamans]|nr:hypothetical protein M0804_008510 [Polistes exclamans]
MLTFKQTKYIDITTQHTPYWVLTKLAWSLLKRVRLEFGRGKVKGCATEYRLSPESQSPGPEIFWQSIQMKFSKQQQQQQQKL